MKTRAALLAMMGIAAAMIPPTHGIGGSPLSKEVDVTPLTEDEKRQRQAKINQSHGLKPFYVDGTLIYALNYKNALRKFKKLNP